MTRLERYAKYFGDHVPEARRLEIAAGAKVEDRPEDKYLDMAIEHAKPRPRDPSEFVGKPLGVRAKRRLLRELREEYGIGGM